MEGYVEELLDSCGVDGRRLKTPATDNLFAIGDSESLGAEEQGEVSFAHS
jgi:hypothetical protein